MSAPQPGRQSPEPERQSNAQSGSTTDKANQQGGAPEGGNAQEVSDEHKQGLSSNPTHPLEKHAEETTSKKV
ncbi:Nn.00g089730.m01.CDS01 [Neocucurbitaria sp. VM-36]